MDILEHNQVAWDAQVDLGNRWTVPVSGQDMTAARCGDWEIFLTPTKAVPRAWLSGVERCRVLCLASGGGQQAPILAAAGATVTVLDNSPKQLERDAELARAHGLAIETVRGNMADLSAFRDSNFEIIVHPVSNCFVPDVRPVWEEAFRVLCPGGRLLAGFGNPIVYVFDQDLEAAGRLEVRHRLPYSDIDSLTPKAIFKLREAGTPLEFSHTLEELIGGQLAAGFAITGMYEDHDKPADKKPLNDYTPTYIATCALKPKQQGGG